MSDTSTTQTDDAAMDQTSSVPQSMSQLLPLVARRLKNYGVIEVRARYEGLDVDFLLVEGAEHKLTQLTAVEVSRTLWTTWCSILERRYPDATRRKEVSGYFLWDVVADTLRHEHVVTTVHDGI